MEKLVAELADAPYRVIVSKGPQADEYELAENMVGEEFLPQTAILPQVDLVITHGGNNTVTESLYFGKPMVALPLFWDQYDNAQRLDETGLGIRLDTYGHDGAELTGAIDRLLGDAGARRPPRRDVEEPAGLRGDTARRRPDRGGDRRGAPEGEMSHRVVVIGGGFGGLMAAKHLARAPVELTLIDRRNFHLFQPLTYQVATGSPLAGGSLLSAAGDLQAPEERAGDARRGDRLRPRRAHASPSPPAPASRAPTSLEYDTLIVAGGSRYSYFGHDEWRSTAPEVKSLESALAARARLLSAFEAAEMEPDEERRRALLTFVVVGAGPTGVEMAGQIAELANSTLPSNFRSIDAKEGRVLLIEAGDRVLRDLSPLALAQRRALARAPRRDAGAEPDRDRHRRRTR